MNGVTNVVLGLALVVLGVGIVTSRKQFIRQVEGFHSKWFRLRYSRTELRFYEYLGILAGLVFIVIGTLAILGIVKFGS